MNDVSYSYKIYFEMYPPTLHHTSPIPSPLCVKLFIDGPMSILNEVLFVISKKIYYLIYKNTTFYMFAFFLYFIQKYIFINVQ